MSLDLAVSTALGSSTASKTAWPSPIVTGCLKKHPERYLESETFVDPPSKRRAELNEREGSILTPVKAIVETRVATKGRFRDKLHRTLRPCPSEARIAKPSGKTRSSRPFTP